MLRRRLALPVIALLALAACSSDSNSSGTASTSAPTTTAAPAPSTDATDAVTTTEAATTTTESPADQALAYSEAGPFPVGVTTLQLEKGPLVEVWYPAIEGSTGTETYDVRDYVGDVIKPLLTGDAPTTFSYPATRDAAVADGSFPVALFVHVLGSALFALVGAFQFVPSLRRHHLTWHRRAGRVLVGAGLLVAVSAVWITLTYPGQPGTGQVLYLVRLVVGPAMAAFVTLGLVAIRRRDIPAHRAWMIRAYALGLGAGTQVFTEGFGEAIFGTGIVIGDVLKVAGWVINLAVAEWVIRRPGRAPRRGPVLMGTRAS